MIDRLAGLLRDAEAQANGNPRGLIYKALGFFHAVPVAKSVNKEWCIVHGLVVKTGPREQIEMARKMSERMGPDFAEVYESGGLWMIQERVAPVANAAAFARYCQRKYDAFDISGNTGTRADGSLAAFDGFLRERILTHNAQ